MSATSKKSKRVTRRDRFKFPFELSEEQIAVKLGFYFGLLEAGLGHEYELDASDEATTGADHEYQGILARYYLQAKAPIGLLGVDAVAVTSQKENEGLNVIRKFRKENDLCDDPYSLCFPLRRPAKHAKIPEELQHNLLYSMRDENNKSFAMYIAPTTYEKSVYLSLLRDRSHWHYLRDGPFWDFRETRIVLHSNVVSEMFMSMPFLQSHICIIPHASVESHEHYYSYSTHANDVAFHSPTILEYSSVNLSDFLALQMRNISRAPEKDIESLDIVVNRLRKTLPESVLAQVSHNIQGSQIQWIKSVGSILKHQYGIHQYLLVKRR